jgi:ABC-type glutathione transport system ATPase component
MNVERPLLDVRDLRIAFGNRRNAYEVVRGISFTINAGETLAIVGESGSGKSVTALSLMGLLPKGSGRVCAGQALFDDVDLFQLSPDQLRRLRAERLAMVFQEPMTSLNPVLSIGLQMTETLITHGRCGAAEARKIAIGMMERTGIPDPDCRFRQFPHEFSGGMRQRVMIAMAMIMKPALLIADEPTTALDVTIQAQILDLMRDLTAESGTSLILITHDMGVVAEMADRVLVMKDGYVVEEALVGELFHAPRKAYTRGLLAAVPRIDDVGVRSVQSVAQSEDPIVRIEGVCKTFARGSWLKKQVAEIRALDDVTLHIMLGETVALVGESGSGKSTLGRAVARLVDVDEGAIVVSGEDITRIVGRKLRIRRAKVQMIFQDPYASLDPRFTVGRTVAEPILIHRLADRTEAKERAAELLRRVGLTTEIFSRFPHELSGGQRQRVAIARALSVEPSIIIADEPTSALDVSVQAQVLDLLAGLRDEYGITMLFITHDLAVVRKIASRVAVMRTGRILEIGPTDAILGDPHHIYTESLISAAPIPDPERRGRKRLTAIAGLYPVGPLVQVVPGHWIAS